MRLTLGYRLRRSVPLLLLPVCQLLTGENFPQSLLRLGRLFPGLRNDSSDISGGYFLAQPCMRLRRNRWVRLPTILFLLPVRQFFTGENFPKSLLRFGRLFAGLRNDCSDIPGGYRLARLCMRLYRNRRDHGRSRGCRPTLLLLLPVCLLLAGENFPQSPLRFGRLLAGFRNDSPNVPGGHFLVRFRMQLRRMRLSHGRRLGRRPAVLLLLSVRQLLTGEKTGLMLLRLASLDGRVRNDRSNVFGCGRPLFFSRWLFRQRFGRSLPLRLHLRKHSIRSPRRALHSTGYLALLCQRRRFQYM